MPMSTRAAQLRYIKWIGRNDPSIDVVVFDGPKLGDKGAEALGDALQANTTVRRLWLSKQAIGPRGANAIADALVGNASIIELDLYDNDVGAEGAKALAGAMVLSGRSIESLDLSRNAIGDEGAKALADVLSRDGGGGGGDAIEQLDVSSNGIGDAGAMELARALVHHLRGLDVSRNVIGAGGAGALGRALCLNPFVADLDCDDDVQQVVQQYLSDMKKDPEGLAESLFRPTCPLGLGLEDVVMIRERLSPGNVAITKGPDRRQFLRAVLAAGRESFVSKCLFMVEPSLPWALGTMGARIGIGALFGVLRERSDLCETEGREQKKA